MGFFGRSVVWLVCARAWIKRLIIRLYTSLLLLLLFKLQISAARLAFVSVCLCFLCVLMYAFYTNMRACTIQPWLFSLLFYTAWVWIYGGLHLRVLTILTTQSVSRCAWALEHHRFFFSYWSNEKKKLTHTRSHKRIKKDVNPRKKRIPSDQL